VSAPALHILVVGAGFAGLAATRKLAGNKNFRITLVERTNHHLFQPLLYQVAMAGLNPSEIASPVRSILRKYPNVTSLMGEVTQIDRANRQVTLDNGEQTISYDYLVLAVGGKTSYFGKNEWEAHTLGLKTLDEALAIRQQILHSFELAERAESESERIRLMTTVLIGGGPTGVEMAGGLAELTRSVIRWDFRNIRPDQARVILLEGSDRLLSAFPEKLSKYTADRLTQMGVDVRLHTRVTDIQAGEVHIGDEVIKCATIVWAAGVGGHPLAKQLNCDLDRGGRAIITPQLHLKEDPRVYCLGDMAALTETLADGKTRALPGVAQVAMQQGALAAKNIVLAANNKELLTFKYWDKGSMATIGRSSAIASTAYANLTGFPAWMAWLFIHLIYIVDFQNQLLVLSRWAWSYFTWKWGARLITRVPKIDATLKANSNEGSPTDLSATEKTESSGNPSSGD
jgi:NADH:ubiquinone reductase (H+-translocating)